MDTEVIKLRFPGSVPPPKKPETLLPASWDKEQTAEERLEILKKIREENK